VRIILFFDRQTAQEGFGAKADNGVQIPFLLNRNCTTLFFGATVTKYWVSVLEIFLSVFPPPPLITKGSVQSRASGGACFENNCWLNIKGLVCICISPNGGKKITEVMKGSRLRKGCTPLGARVLWDLRKVRRGEAIIMAPTHFSEACNRDKYGLK